MTMLAKCFLLFQMAKSEERPLSRNDLFVLTEFSQEGCTEVLRVMRSLKLIKIASEHKRGRGVYYELVEGAVCPSDQRGKSPKAREKQAKGLAAIKARRENPLGMADEIDSITLVSA